MTIEKIKKNLNINGAKILLKKTKAFFPGKYRDYVAKHYLHLVNQNKEKKKNKIKIGFIVQLPEIWDKSVDVYNEMKTRNNVEVVLLTVPPYDLSEGKLGKSYENNYFLETYPDAIRAIDDNGRVIDIEALKLDYVFYPRPYDHYLPYELRSSQLLRYTRCCYIPYGFSGADIFNEGNTNKDFFRNIYITFHESDYMKKIFLKKFKKSYRSKIQHFESLGYPSLENYMNFSAQVTNEKKTILWTPRWSCDERIGGSNFLKYKDYMINIKEEIRDINMIFRPHPLMFEEMVRTKRMSEKEVTEYKERLRQKKIDFDSGTPIDETIKKSDVLVTDYSSIMIMFFLTGKPIVYCDSNIQFNESLEKIRDCIYIVRNQNELDEVLNKLRDGKDHLKEKRDYIIKTEFSNCNGASKKIVDYVINDYYTF